MTTGKSSRCHSQNPLRDVVHAVVHPALQPAGDAAQNRQIDQRHQKRGRQHEDQRDRQHAHELAGDAGPEQHRQKRAERGGRGTDHRPEHALGRPRIGMHRTLTLGDALVGIFHDDDRPVDQHPDREDQAEHHDIRHRHAHHRQQGKA